jgi:hypothetical protein
VVYGRVHSNLLDWKHRINHPLGSRRALTLSVPIMFDNGRSLRRPLRKEKIPARRLGIAGDRLEGVVVAATVDCDRWVRMMLREEYGLPAAVRSPWRAPLGGFDSNQPDVRLDRRAQESMVDPGIP